MVLRQFSYSKRCGFTVFPGNVAVGEAGEVSHMKRRYGLFRAGRQRLGFKQLRQAEVENVIEAFDVGPRDPVTVYGEPHCFKECQVGGPAYVSLLDASQSSGIGARNSRECVLGILAVEICKDHLDPALQCAALCFGGRSDRSTEKNDAKIRVASSGVEARLDGAPDPEAHLETASGDVGRGGARAHFEMTDLHSVAGRVNMHVAGLQCFEFILAGTDKCVSDRGSIEARSRHELTGFSEAKKCSASVQAMLMSVTLCSPFHAGLELISSTSRFPS